MDSKALFLGWLRTFVCSYIFSLIAGVVFATVEMHGQNISHSVGLIAWGALYLHIVLFIMSMLSFFIMVPSFYQNVLMRLILYFGGGIIFIMALLFAHLKDVDKAFYLMISIIYLLVSMFFYRQLIKKIAR